MLLVCSHCLQPLPWTDRELLERKGRVRFTFVDLSSLLHTLRPPPSPHPFQDAGSQQELN